MEATFVVIGGGIAGVTCTETLAFYQPTEKIILISESSLIKTVTNLQAITQTLTHFDIEENNIDVLTLKYENVTVIHDALTEIQNVENIIITAKHVRIKYKYLCLCMGAVPKLIATDNPYIIGIRDTDSVETFMQKLKQSKKVCIIGNGGIASELVHKIQQTEINWVIKDKHITATFVDPGAAEFFKDRLIKSNTAEKAGPSKRMRYTDNDAYKAGAALGPDWYKNLNIKGAISELYPTSVNIHYQCELSEFKIDENDEFPVTVKLTNGEIIKCDFIVSATGVEARSNFKTTPKLTLSADMGIIVDEFMQTNINNIYAAGDICSPNWDFAAQWFPMKLWTQARQMGCYVAKCMSGAHNKEVIIQDFCFELFTHTTKLFGYKVILLGLYNGQKLNNDYEILFRMTKGLEYIKLVMQNGRLQGAVLIGDTDMEEVFENLILNQFDLSIYKEDLLNPDIDIEDYFD